MMSKAPILILALQKTTSNGRYKAMIWILTFLTYTSYHLSRRPITIVKNVLHKDCKNGTTSNNASSVNLTGICGASWEPFGQDHPYEDYFAVLDSSYLAAYAVGMFISGHIAERMNLRYFLAGGMMLSGLVTAAFGLGEVANIHSLAFFVVVQVVCGLVQSSGWPGVVATMGNWFGKGRRGLIMGIWNAHTSVGNILGGVIAAAFLTPYWEPRGYWFWSFLIPGIIIAGMGLIVFLILIPHPEDVGLPDPNLSRELDIPAERTPLINESEADTFSDPETQFAPQPRVRARDHDSTKPISLLGAFKVPGVAEFAFCLFFAKLVSYTFLYWLPQYIKQEMKRYVTISDTTAGDLSTVFDMGGVLGSITAGFMSDVTGSSAITCAILLVLSIPMMVLYKVFGALSFANAIGLLFAAGLLVNGPYCLITTSVSADLGTHPSLAGNAKALATVTAIIDGVGSIGAALGPGITGIIQATSLGQSLQMDIIFGVLIASNCMALLLLSRLIYKEAKVLKMRWKTARE